MCFSLRDPRHFSRVFSKDVLNEWVKNESTKWIKSTRIRGLPSLLAATMLVSKISSTLQICLLGWSSWVALVVKSIPVKAGTVRDAGVIPGSRRSPGGGHGNTLQYSCLENPKDRGSWRAAVHRDTKIQTQLKWLSSSNRSFGYMHKSCGRTGALWEAIRKVWNRMPASQLNSLASTLLNTAKLEAPLYGSRFQRTEREVCQEQVLTHLHISLPFTNLYFLPSQIPPLLSSPDCTWHSCSYCNLGNLEFSPLSKGQDRRGWQFSE